MARFLVVSDTSTRAELEEAIANLRDRQRKAVIPSTRDELAADIDELVERWVSAPA